MYPIIARFSFTTVIAALDPNRFSCFFSYEQAFFPHKFFEDVGIDLLAVTGDGIEVNADIVLVGVANSTVASSELVTVAATCFCGKYSSIASLIATLTADMVSSKFKSFGLISVSGGYLNALMRFDWKLLNVATKLIEARTSSLLLSCLSIFSSCQQCVIG